MMKINFTVLTIIMLVFECSCSLGTSYPEARITIKVVNEKGLPIKGARVGIGFEINAGNGTKEIPVIGQTNSGGLFTGKANAASVVGFNASKDGYYKTYGEYRFKVNKMGHWEPWNPELNIVLRKIVNPVPMYARDNHLSPLEIPETGKKIGFDLVEYDWVRPYGKGTHSDFIFKLDKNFVSDLDFSSFLTITFPHKFDGIHAISEERLVGSQFKLLRFAPEASYEKNITLKLRRVLGKPMEDSSDKKRNYIFRIRSEEKQGKLLRAMYGKILGDIEFDPRGSKTAKIFIKYYLNPDYTRNLEFDPNRNLFTDLKSTENVGIE